MNGRTDFLGLKFDDLDMSAMLSMVRDMPADRPFGYVVTPNVDHVVRLERADEEVRTAYGQAEILLCDSRVLARLARFTGRRLTVVPGSDLTRGVLESAVRPGDRLCVIGGDAAQISRLAGRFPDVEFVQHVPPMGLRHKPDAMQAAIAFAASSGARITFLAVGSPQQELLALGMLRSGRCYGLGLCIGASIDFLTGRQRRAPRWMQRMGMEWLHRLASNPARMWRRYIVDGSRIFRLVIAWQAKGGRGGAASDGQS